MSPRRPSRPTVVSPQPGAPRLERQGALLRKYRELLAKHEALVHKLELRNDEHITTHRLSSWALETSASGLALLGDGVVLLANRRWHELARSGPWYRMRQGQPLGPALKTLRQAAEAAGARLSELGDLTPLVERYQEQSGIRTVELRTERVGLPTRNHARRAVLVLVHDITSQVQAEKELEQTRAALTQQEHLRALGELASGVAHDLNNTLNSMKLRLEMLERDTEFATRNRSHLDSLVRIVSDAGTRLRRLQDFARQRPEALGDQVQLGDIIQEAVEIARSDLEHRAAREGISLTLQVEVPALPLVNGSGTDLRYVFINLLLNARDAMPHGGTLRIRSKVAEDKVIVTVEDEGTGIPEQNLRSIFRPFFTTKGDKGTGLGLSMAYGVMARSGGSITAANRREGGAVFTLCFPLPVPQENPPEDSNSAPKRGKSATRSGSRSKARS